MDRRDFLTKSGITGAVTLGSLNAANNVEAAEARDYYELRQYTIETEDQLKALEAFMRNAAIPALNRIGITPVGIFLPREGISPLYMLLHHQSPELLSVVTQKLLTDKEFLTKGASLLNATASNPAYSRVESSLMVAFAGAPKLETPVKARNRVFQLRIYESPTIKTGQKKIEMFNTAELAIFRRVGLNPVFFGETLIGAKIPNLAYMVGFNSAQDQDEAWKRFSADPEWKKLRAMPEYDDKEILCGITNLLLKPSECSQI